ncbi:hypothetical protein C7S18_03445 [Ahniella affigens]|uniref:AsmA domain-containing protein n=1 Tax=Ahniella affigens TaxID=2021234 RepID=A0A2P1PN78_9GAMM|nr:hypothetical protein [Ahniella affigens]AVP96300.1 hypothetical protein C7S18_03445 [Ahniella affigens]
MSRSRLRFWALLLIPAFALTLLAINRLREDSERLTRFVQDFVLRETGLSLTSSKPGTFDFWPQLSLSLSDVNLKDGEATVAAARQLSIQLPWSALRGDTLQLGGVQVEALILQGPALGAWWDRQYSADLGPAQPWQWPELTAPLQIDALQWQGSSPDDSWSLKGLSLDRLQPGQMSRLELQVRLPKQEQDIPIVALLTPSQAGPDLQLSPFALNVDPGIANIEISGNAAFNHLQQFGFDGALKTGDLSRRIGMDALDLDQQSALALQTRGYLDGALRLRAVGQLFGEAIDLDIGLPADWRAHLDPPMALLDVLQGQIKLARLRIGMSEWVRLSIEGKPLEETVGTALPPQAPAPAPAPEPRAQPPA